MINSDDAQGWLTLIKNLSGPGVVGLEYALMLIIIIFVFIIIEIVNLSTKQHGFNYIRVLLQSLVAAGIGLVTYTVIDGRSMILSLIISILVGIVVYTKWIKEFVDSIGERDGNSSKNSVFSKKYEREDILDILIRYGYISSNQVTRLFHGNILDCSDGMVDNLLEMRVITRSELDEARVIENLSKLKGRRVTKEEAKEYIKSNKLYRKDDST